MLAFNTSGWLASWLLFLTITMDPTEFRIDMGMAGVALALIKPLALQMLRILVVDTLAN